VFILDLSNELTRTYSNNVTMSTASLEIESTITIGQQSRVVLKAVNANPGLHVNRSIILIFLV